LSRDNGGHQGDLGGDQATADLDDRPLEASDFATYLAKVVIDPGEAGIHASLEVVEATVCICGEIVEARVARRSVTFCLRAR
jgi:hypothetical protein